MAKINIHWYFTPGFGEGLLVEGQQVGVEEGVDMHPVGDVVNRNLLHLKALPALVEHLAGNLPVQGRDPTRSAGGGQGQIGHRVDITVGLGLAA